MTAAYPHNGSGPEASGSRPGPDLKPEDIAFLRAARDTVSSDPVLETALQVSREANRLRQQAIERGEAYPLIDLPNADISTMFRAIESEGPTVADARHIDPRKLEVAWMQLDGALGDKLNHREEQGAAVDAATYIIAALSLAHRLEVVDNPAERIAVTDALDSLRDVANFDRVRQEQTLGPHTGELAVDAIIEYSSHTT